jgi:hypothetical protein
MSKKRYIEFRLGKAIHMISVKCDQIVQIQRDLEEVLKDCIAERTQDEDGKVPNRYYVKDSDGNAVGHERDSTVVEFDSAEEAADWIEVLYVDDLHTLRNEWHRYVMDGHHEGYYFSSDEEFYEWWKGLGVAECTWPVESQSSGQPQDPGHAT